MEQSQDAYLLLYLRFEKAIGTVVTCQLGTMLFSCSFLSIRVQSIAIYIP